MYTRTLVSPDDNVVFCSDVPDDDAGACCAGVVFSSFVAEGGLGHRQVPCVWVSSRFHGQPEQLPPGKFVEVVCGFDSLL